MRMLLRFSLLAMVIASIPAWAQDPVVEALGGASLVLEEETSKLNLFNLGNPAGMAFLPKQNRVDLTLSVAPRNRLAEFSTGAEGSAGQFSPSGTTLTPSSVYTRQTQTWSYALEPRQEQSYGGVLLSLSDAIALQLIPQAHYAYRYSTDSGATYREQSGGVDVRSSWLMQPNWSLGAGVKSGSSWEEGWTEPDWLPTHDMNTPTFINDYRKTQMMYGAELGTMARFDAVFDNKDYMDVGVLFSGAYKTERMLYTPDWLNAPSQAEYQGRTLPWHTHLQALYSFQSLLELALEAGYENQQWFRSLAADQAVGENEHLSQNLDNLDYALSFRVRLPMVRNDDLRFGVLFDNRGFEHPYATGRMAFLDDHGGHSQNSIETVSSSIGIGTAFVPAEGSIVAFEYRLGSSKSRQDGAVPNTSNILAKSGFTRFAFGVQYSLFDNLALRLGFSNQRVVYESESPTLRNSNNKPVIITKSVETSGLRFGLGLEEGPITLDLTCIYERVAHSSSGWAFEDMPLTGASVSQDQDTRVITQLGITHRF